MRSISLKKDFFKLIDIGVYGKTMENFILSKCEEPEPFSQKIFSSNFLTIHEIKLVLRLYKPTYVGFAIFDFSKLLMHEFYYKYIGVKYGGSTSLLFSDTDSLVYGTETDDAYEDFYENRSLFDFSDCPKDS